MAKGNFLTSTVRGKLGEMVGYKNTNSNDKVKQGWRAYVPHISNPKTAGQATQRMIVSNLTQNYTALKSILQRSFEGVKYGGKSYQRFLSLNMKNAGNGPFIPKGTRSTPLPIPGLKISEGSLISIDTFGMLTWEGKVALKTDLYMSNVVPEQTIGDISQALIDNNSDVRAGDQLTFICVSVTENLEYVYRFASFIIDPDSTTALTTTAENFHVVGDTGVIYRLYGAGGNDRAVAFTLVDPATDEIPVAGAVIQSRQAADGKWLRSPSTLYVNTDDEEIMQYFSDEMYQLALESYMGAGSSRASDWPTEPDATVTAVWAKSLTRAEFTIQDVSHTGNVASLVSSDFQTIKYIVRTDNGVQYLTNLDGSVFMYSNSPVPASALTGTSATRELVDINGLAEYNISNLRSAAPAAEVEEPDTRKKKVK